MRLLSTSEVRLQEFFGSQIPPYAILSHRWLEEEIVLQDLAGLRGSWDALDKNDESAAITSKKGFAKLARAVELARKDDYDFIWIDTCCIDKTSSADLSEAINSMYSWYEKADVCYAYFYDVQPAFLDDIYVPTSSFRNSSWFKRGWTLQELIAPSEVEFFASDWSYIGTKREMKTFLLLLQDITGVPKDVLLGDVHPWETSVASRMKWAANRETTRLEDIAYCLLGVFNVNMPLLYGEGEKAFIRLQEQILSQNVDESIFAWHTEESTSQGLYGLLADHPSWFRDSGHLEPVSRLTLGEPWAMTSKGLKVSFKLHPCTDVPGADCFVILNCETQDSGKRSPVIYLKRTWVDEFARVVPDKSAYRHFGTGSAKTTAETVFVKQNPLQLSRSIRVTMADEWSGRVQGVHPISGYSKGTLKLSPSDFRLHEALALFRVNVEDCGIIEIVVGLQLVDKTEFRGWCMQLRAGSSNWGVEENFWVFNQLLRRGDIPKLSESSDKDIHGKSLPTVVTLEERHGFRTLDLIVNIRQQTVGEAPAYPLADPIDEDPAETALLANIARFARFDISRPGLEPVSPNSMPVPAVRIALSDPAGATVQGRTIRFQPVQLMNGLVSTYVEIFNAGDTDWAGCTKVGQVIHEACKRHLLPPFECTSPYSMVYKGAVDDSSFEAVASALPDTFGFTAFHWAILTFQLDLAKRLLEHKPEFLFELTKHNFSVFHFAAAMGNENILNALVDYILREDVPLAKLRSREHRVETITLASSSTHDSPLHLAAAFATELSFWDVLSPEAWNYLIGNSATPNNAWGATPLHVAALTGNLAAVISLMTRPVYRPTSGPVYSNDRDERLAMARNRVIRTDDLGRTAVWYAAYSNSPEIIKRLDGGYAPLDMADEHSIAPIHVACHLGHVSALAALIECGANINCPAWVGGGWDGDGQLPSHCLLPTHIAALYGQKECLEVLLNASAEARSVNPGMSGFAAISLAVANGHPECAKLLWSRYPKAFSGVVDVLVIQRSGTVLIEKQALHISENDCSSRRISGARPYPPVSPRTVSETQSPLDQRQYPKRETHKNPFRNLFRSSG